MPDLQTRLRPKKDKDIIDAFKNVTNQSERLRELVRLGLQYEAIMRLGLDPKEDFIRQDVAREQKRKKPKDKIVVRMNGATSSSKDIEVESTSAITRNLLAGFD